MVHDRRGVEEIAPMTGREKKKKKTERAARKAVGRGRRGRVM